MSLATDILYDYFIKPTERPASTVLGLEFEFPIVKLSGGPVDFPVVHALTDAFITQFPFAAAKYDDDGSICMATDAATGDSLSYDCSYNTVEFSLGVRHDLFQAQDALLRYYTFCQDFLAAHDHALTGMGINPHWHINHAVPIPNGRYRMLFHYLSSYTKYPGRLPFHPYPMYGLFINSAQIQLDVEKDSLVQTLNTFNALEPVAAILFANSSFDGGYLLSRDHFWRESMHGYNPKNVDVYDEDFTSIDDIVAHIASESVYCVEKDGKYINFLPTPWKDYVEMDNVIGEYFNGKNYEEIAFAPAPEDVAYHRAYHLDALTYRGTIEFRSVCEQPVREVLVPAAFYTGLKTNLENLTAYLSSKPGFYGEGYTSRQLRAAFCLEEWPAFVHKNEVKEVVENVLNIARKGLMIRGKGEEHFLDPAYERAEKLENPAQEFLRRLRAGERLQDLIVDYGRL